ncbi:MAG TPA: efflux RND transporter periplasmic adaptor subunit [Vicinamibacterales bacterium]|nr:efflux RND transporter periplasmic adaptor subunit [Vicinamibacterales bacterium]
MNRMFAATVGVTLFAGSASCGRQEPVAPPVIRPVKYTQVFAAGTERTRTFSGIARPALESTLSFRVSGRVNRVLVDVGSRVRPDQLIAELDPVDYELQVKQVEAALRQAEAQASNAEADLRRVRGLYENDNASRDDLDAAIAGAASAQAQVESAAKQLELARRQVGYTRLLAPVAGAIADVRIEENENVMPGQAVAVLTAGLQPEVELAVPESLITRIAERERVTIRFDALPDRRFEGLVKEVGVTATALATTFPVTVQLRDAGPDVRPGMAAAVTFEFPAREGGERFVVPAEAVGEDREGRFVFVAVPAQGEVAVARRRAVTVGEFTSEGLEILRGLTDGEFVITAGVSRIEDGREVRLTGGQTR